MREIAISTHFSKDASDASLSDRRANADDLEGSKVDHELREYLIAMEARILERCATKDDLERVETALLTEFHKWASPAEMRAKSHAQAIRLMDTELESLSERIDKLEGKKPS